jgi:hypothetical protein
MKGRKKIESEKKSGTEKEIAREREGEERGRKLRRANE